MTATPESIKPLPAMTPELHAAYHRLWDLWWNKTATLEADLGGYSYIDNAELAELDGAAEAIEKIVCPEAEHDDD
jgi:hypothetical protein